MATELEQQIFAAVKEFNGRLESKGIELDHNNPDNSIHLINYLRRNNIPTTEWSADNIARAYSHLVKTGALTFMKGKEPLRFRSTVGPTTAELDEQRAKKDKEVQANTAAAKVEADAEKFINTIIENFHLDGPNGLPRHGASGEYKVKMVKGVAILRKQGKKFSEILPDVRVWIADKQAENERENLVSTSARRR